jgi:hypothetical protein
MAGEHSPIGAAVQGTVRQRETTWRRLRGTKAPGHQFTQLLEDNVDEFLFVWAPLKIVGGTGSPGNPVAIYWARSSLVRPHGQLANIRVASSAALHQIYTEAHHIGSLIAICLTPDEARVSQARPFLSSTSAVTTNLLSLMRRNVKGGRSSQTVPPSLLRGGSLREKPPRFF